MNGSVARRVAATSLTVAALTWSGCERTTVEVIPPRQLPMKGFSYTSFTADGFAQGGTINAVGDLQSQTGNTWIALCVFEYQRSPTDTTIGANTTGVNPVTGGPWSTSSTMSDLREGIREARSKGMRVLLAPHVDLYSGEWRALITPDSGGGWFRSYTAMMLGFAQLASEEQIEMLCIGTEYVEATRSRYTSQWKELIATIRSSYGGKLIYAANWSGVGALSAEPEFEQIGFWDNLDYIGIDAYYPVTSSKDDSIPAFAGALDRLAAPQSAIASLASRTGRQVVFTEMGIQSVKGALSAPWDFSLGSATSAAPDTAAQAFYYSVVLRSFGVQEWCDGIFWWNWESVPTSNEATNYTPRNKPAARVLERWYATGIL